MSSESESQPGKKKTWQLKWITRPFAMGCTLSIHVPVGEYLTTEHETPKRQSSKVHPEPGAQTHHTASDHSTDSIHQEYLKELEKAMDKMMSDIENGSEQKFVRVETLEQLTSVQVNDVTKDVRRWMWMCAGQPGQPGQPDGDNITWVRILCHADNRTASECLCSLSTCKDPYRKQTIETSWPISI